MTQLKTITVEINDRTEIQKAFSYIYLAEACIWRAAQPYEMRGALNVCNDLIESLTGILNDFERYDQDAELEAEHVASCESCKDEGGS